MFPDRKDYRLKRYRQLPQSTLSAFVTAYELSLQQGYSPFKSPAEIFAGTLLEKDPELFKECSVFGITPDLFRGMTPPVSVIREAEYPALWLQRTRLLFPDIKIDTMVPAAVFLTLMRFNNSGVGAIIQFRTSIGLTEEYGQANPVLIRDELALDKLVLQLTERQIQRELSNKSGRYWKDGLPKIFWPKLFRQKQLESCAYS